MLVYGTKRFILALEIVRLFTFSLAGLIGRPMMFLNAGMALVYLQACMGIGCLLYEVPVPLGAAHQLGSVFLLGSMVAFSHEMRRGRVLQAVKKMT